MSEAERDADYRLVAGRDEYAREAAALVASAAREIAILSYELEREIYGTDDFLHAARRFVMQHRHARMRILLNSPARALHEGSRLIALGRGMPSFVAFRALAPERLDLEEEVLIADGRRLLVRGARLERNARFYTAPHVARLKQKDFDGLWEEGEPAQELRPLRL